MLKSYFLPSKHSKGFLRVIADSEQADELKALGYLGTEAEAVAASDAQDAELPTRAELEAKAMKLGIEYSPTVNNKNLLAKINKKLAGG